MSQVELTKAEAVVLRTISRTGIVPASDLNPTVLEKLLSLALVRRIGAGDVGVTSRGTDWLQHGQPTAAAHQEALEDQTRPPLGVKPFPGRAAPAPATNGNHAPMPALTLDDLTAAQKDVLECIALHSEPVERTTLNRKGVHFILARLLKDGLIEESNNYVALTPLARALVGNIGPRSGPDERATIPLDAGDPPAAIPVQVVAREDALADPPQPLGLIYDEYQPIGDVMAELIQRGQQTNGAEAADAINQFTDEMAAYQANGCGECFDCLDRRVLGVLMQTNPAVRDYYEAQAAIEAARAVQDAALDQLRPRQD